MRIMNTVKTNTNIRDSSPRHATSHKNVTVRTVPVGTHLIRYMMLLWVGEKMYRYRLLDKVFICSMLVFAMILFTGSFHGDNQEKISDTNTISLMPEIPVPSCSQLESTIRNIDLNERGELAIALNDERVILMDPSGVILKSFRFQCDADYVVAWSGENLCLHMRRDKHLYLFSPEGIMLSVIDKDEFQEEEIWKKLSRQLITDEHGNCYQLGNGGFRLVHYYSFDRLTKTAPTGETSVLYDVYGRHIHKVLLKYAFVITPCIFFCALVVFHRWSRRGFQGGQSGPGDGVEKNTACGPGDDSVANSHK